jgi:hypothetical protein
MTQNIIDTNGRPGWRDYELDIIVGELYEVWLHHDWEEPKTCVPVIKIASPITGRSSSMGRSSRSMGGQVFRIGTATAPMPPFTLPIVKSAPARLFINEIVKVQPMTMPVSSIFHMDYKFGKEKE